MQVFKLSKAIAIVALATALTLLSQQTAQACGLLDLDCFFGWSGRTTIRENGATERARIDAEHKSRMEELQRSLDIRTEELLQQESIRSNEITAGKELEIERIKAAAAQVEQDNLYRIEQEKQQGLLSAEQARQQGEIVTTLIQAERDQRLSELTGSFMVMSDALLNQTNIARNQIKEVGETERLKIKFDAFTNWIFILMILAVGVLIYRSKQQAQWHTLPNNQYPQLPRQQPQFGPPNELIAEKRQKPVDYQVTRYRE